MSGSETDRLLRLNRYLARAGLGSRRGVEQAIRAGEISINGEVVTDLTRRVDPRRDVVTVAGQRVTLPQSWRVYAFYKPHGVVSSLRAQGTKPCLALFRDRARLPAAVMPVGRLDAETTGLLLWTDDGDLAQALCRPSNRVWKRYEVFLDAPLDTAGKEALTTGKLALDGRNCLPLRLVAAKSDGRHWILELHEGRHRQIRRMFALVGRSVMSLHRTGIGPISLGLLRAGDFRRLTRQEEGALRREVGRGAPPTP